MADDNKIEKKVIAAPSLPNIVQGDGRVVMSLLKSFMEQLATQVNLANGFTAEDIKPENGKYPTPKNFFLQFSRIGGYLSWDRLADESELAYYETRFGADRSSSDNVLDRTVESFSYKLPYSFVGQVYLWAISKEGYVSNATVINYSKARPDAPPNRSISLVKSAEGTLLTFQEIPLNCIGVNIYINSGNAIDSLDNIYLIKHDESFVIKRVEIAYYDNFGEGERGVLYTEIPAVNGFYVERNGASLDFYWQAMNIYGVEYVVRIGDNANWDSGLTVFKTKLNKHRLAYPPTERQCYWMIKAVDEHNNYSVLHSYYIVMDVPEIDKNVIVCQKEIESMYSGSKVNLYFDYGASGLKLARDASRGEYIIFMRLPQRYRARNWPAYKISAVTNTKLKWPDLMFKWTSPEAKRLKWAGNVVDTSGIVIKTQIATYRGTGLDPEILESISFNNSLLADKGSTVTAAIKASDYRSARWHNGLYISDFTNLEYLLRNVSRAFSLFFVLKKSADLDDCMIMTLSDGVYFLLLGYDKRLNEFYLRGSDGKEVRLMVEFTELDFLSLAIVQGQNKRSLLIHSFSKDKSFGASIDAVPVGKLNVLYCYKKIIV